MEKTILLILQKHREETAVKVQAILTEYGCFIKTRLGIHDGPPSGCSPSGLIILELVGSKDEAESCKKKLEELSNVSVELVHMKVD